MLERILNGNNIFFRSMGRLGDFMCLNLLYIITCVPIITIGAATSALYDVLYQISKGEDGHCLNRFVRSFHKHLKKATGYWCVCLFLLVFIGMGVLGIFLMSDRIQFLFQGLAVILSILWMGFTCFGLVLIAWTDTPIKMTMKNAFYITLGSFPWLMVSVFLTCLPGITIFTMHIRIVAYIIPMLLLFGVVLLDYFKIFVYKQALKKYELFEKGDENDA